MRLTELKIENYGGYAVRNVVIPETAGLAVIYGPNEAGKSTCLEAIGDFLFTIPKNTIRGNLYGYDGMRISASMRLADDRLLSLKRRKGNGKTLMDVGGNALDEAALAPVLGSITRERFETLFGLNHDTLRGGGERLLQADGDIGRLIVEAGGGLRTLLARLDTIDEEAARLFDVRRSSTRTFYQQLSVFEEADRTVRAGQFTRESYEQARKHADAASSRLRSLRDERRTLAARMIRTERTVRIAPRLIELDGLTAAIEELADVAALPVDFAARVGAAAALLEEANGKLGEATDRCDRISMRIDGLMVSSDLVAAESRIRDAAELSIHVAKARGDRPNRQTELEQSEAQLIELRRMIPVSANDDLAQLLPDRDATERVRALMGEASERRPDHLAARARVAEMNDAINAIEGRVSGLRSEGFDQALETSSSQFSGIAAQRASIDARRLNLEEEYGQIGKAATSLGFEGVDELRAFMCPTADQIRVEQASRDALEAQRSERDRDRRQAVRDIAAGAADAAALQAGGTIANDEAVRHARGVRTLRWAPVRTSFVSGTTSGTEADRIGSADAYEAALDDSDAMADRRAQEAERAASLAQAQRRVADATSDLSWAEEELARLASRMEEQVTAFREAFPAATNLHPSMASLLNFAERRMHALDQASIARNQATALTVDAALLEPVLELATAAERRLGIAAVPEFATRMQALVVAHGRHERRHADYLRECADLETSRLQSSELKSVLDRMDAEESAFDAEWPSALAALHAPVTLSLAGAGELLGEWAAARGILSAIAQTRQRLDRMDDDEARLDELVRALGRDLDIETGADCVAGAKLLMARWEANATSRTQRDGLLPDLQEAKLEVRQAEHAAARAIEERERLAGLAEVAATNAALSEAAARHERRAVLVEAVSRNERNLLDLGGGLTAAELRSERGDVALDELEAGLLDDRSRSADLEADVEEAVLAEKVAGDALAAFAAESAVAGAVVKRESAATQMHEALERYLELKTARDLITQAISKIRGEQQDPLIRRASELFAASTRGEFDGVDTDIDGRGNPIVVGRRANGGTASVATMSDGTRDQLFLSFRLASLENYGDATEPLPFIADDVLVHFDDDRSAATLELLAEFGRRNQVLLFTHHRSVRDLAEPLVVRGLANIVSLQRGDTPSERQQSV